MSTPDFYKIAIARGLPASALIPGMSAAFDGGFTHGEVTMNTPGAADMIKRCRSHFGDSWPIGAGTVTDLEVLHQALDAGAQFIVTPNFDPEVAKRCREASIPFFPGALTPTEIFQAWKAGALAVKVFPVSALGGVPYVKDLKGPFPQIPLLACGGVTPENFLDYVRASVAGIAIGGSLFKETWIAQGDWDQIKRFARSFS